MRLPLITYDIHLSRNVIAPVATVYREDIAVRIIEFLHGVTQRGGLALPDGTLVQPREPYYVAAPRVVTTSLTSLAEAAAAQLTIDYALMDRAVDLAVAEREAAAEEPPPVVEEPPPVVEEPLSSDPSAL